MDKEILICKCGNIEHQIVIFEDEEMKGWNEAFATIHLAPVSFFRRLKYAIKYIFNIDTKHGHFDDFIFDENDIPKLKKLITFLEKTDKEELKCVI